jgi:PAS domain-containing protein
LTQRRAKTIEIIRERFNVEVDWRMKTELVKSDIEATIQTYRKLLEPLASPTIIYDRSGVIHYVNPAYRVLTGFSYTLPTERTEFAFFKVTFTLLVTNIL